jgi:hypothetical protein
LYQNDAVWRNHPRCILLSLLRTAARQSLSVPYSQAQLLQ